MFYDEGHYLTHVLPKDFSWRELPEEFWWNYRKGIVAPKALKLMISLTKKVRRGSASHTGKSMLLIIEVILRLNIAVALKFITVITMVIFKLTRCVNETLT